MPAVKIDVNAMPASTTVRRDEPPRPATAKMSPATHSAPRKAATGASPKALGNVHAASSTKKPEPAFTPIMFGLARGVVERSLDERTCLRERGAGKKRGEHARQADVPDDVCRCLISIRAKGEREHVIYANGGRADNDAEHRGASQQHRCGNHCHHESSVCLQGMLALPA